jgi:hypothetical protein
VARRLSRNCLASFNVPGSSYAAGLESRDANGPWLVINSSILNLEVLPHGDLSALRIGPVPKRLGECIRKTQIQYILLEQEACTGHRNTFKLACNHVHGCVLIEAFFGSPTVKRHEGDVDLNVLT